MKRSRQFSSGNKFCWAMVLIHLSLGGRTGTLSASPEEQEIEEQFMEPNKPAMKSTIKGADGDIIDCVDIYKQPAFDHPLLKEHSIEIQPSYYPPNEDDNNTLSAAVYQPWQKYGSCPNGTIPILRIENEVKGEPTECKVETAGAEGSGEVLGARGKINVWGIPVEANEWSMNSLTVFNNKGDSFIENGWMVSSELYGDDGSTRVFIRWKNGDSGKGCFNLMCPGFIQVNRKFALGAKIEPLSQYNGRQTRILPMIYRDNIQNKWWLVCNGEVLGYWPGEVLAGFESGWKVRWGGSVCDMQNKGLHTTTPMGSGRFPREGWGKSSFVRDMLMMSLGRDWFKPAQVDYAATSEGCYQVVGGIKFVADEGWSMYYGGPGGQCCDARCNKERK